MAVMGTYRDRPREAESGEVQSSPAFRPTGVTSSREVERYGQPIRVLWEWPKS